VPDEAELREAENQEIDARLKALNERIDRHFIFQDLIDRTLEERVEDLEAKMHRLRRLVIWVAFESVPQQTEALDRLEELLDKVERGEASLDDVF
jgi:hypothetical protein